MELGWEVKLEWELDVELGLEFKLDLGWEFDLELDLELEMQLESGNGIGFRTGNLIFTPSIQNKDGDSSLSFNFGILIP